MYDSSELDGDELLDVTEDTGACSASAMRGCLRWRPAGAVGTTSVQCTLDLESGAVSGGAACFGGVTAGLFNNREAAGVRASSCCIVVITVPACSHERWYHGTVGTRCCVV